MQCCLRFRSVLRARGPWPKCYGYHLSIIIIKKYLHEVCDAGSKFFFKFRSGTQGQNEKLGRHRKRESKTSALCVGMSVRM